MTKYLIYLTIGFLIALLVLLETWLTYRKMDAWNPDREEVVYKGVSNAFVYGAFWPTTLILFVYGLINNKLLHHHP